jgi:sporulation protein YlmC with PRC-barrel domain
MSRTSKGTGHMHSHRGFGFITATAVASLISSAAIAQDAQPNAGSPATTVTTTNWMTQEATGQWRASKMIGLNVYNNDNEKIGDIAELIVDRSGKLEALVVGAGGFLGLGERDVAIPYGQISWSFQRPGLSGTSTSTAPPTTGAGRLDLAGSPYRGETLLAPAGPNSENARTYPDNRAGAITDSAQERRNSGDALSYPDHAVLNMTKDQLKDAPAFKYSR